MARMAAIHRKRMIQVHAARIAGELGLSEVTFENVAHACPIETSPSTVRHYFRFVSDLWLAAIEIDDGLRKQAREMGLIE